MNSRSPPTGPPAEGRSHTLWYRARNTAPTGVIGRSYAHDVPCEPDPHVILRRTLRAELRAVELKGLDELVAEQLAPW